MIIINNTVHNDTQYINMHNEKRYMKCEQHTCTRTHARTHARRACTRGGRGTRICCTMYYVGHLIFNSSYYPGVSPVNRLGQAQVHGLVLRGATSKRALHGSYVPPFRAYALNALVVCEKLISGLRGKKKKSVHIVA